MADFKRLKNKIAAAALAVAAFAALPPGGEGTTAFADIDLHTSYIGMNREPSVIVPPVKTHWSAAMDKHDELMEQGVAAAGSGKLFVIRGGRLLALEPQTGQRLWTFGAKLKAPILYEDGVVYTSSESGVLFAADADSGKKLWATGTPSKGATRLYVEDGRLLALNGDIQAYRLSDGGLLWRDGYDGQLPGPLLTAGGRVFASSEESGAYTYEVLHAFDAVTGKEIWEAADEGFPIAASDDTVIVQRQQDILDKGMLTTLDTIEIATGKTIKTTVYNPEHVDLSQVEYYSPGKAWISGGRVYIAAGSKVYGYPADGKPDDEARDAYLSPAPDAVYAAGPQEGRLLFASVQGIYGVKLINKGPVWYTDGISNPIARFDLIGRGMYVAQTDGRLIAVDLIAGKAVAQIQTYGRVFGPTLSADGMVAVQTKGKLVVFPEPASLKHDEEE
ncbi:PQQ-binding-like beta-propeller repeat protein [Paenibacillus humicola]|uniref:PQQ-binding-like beta-propeller repeat protein n=1 Tax=Paenibacillus humicola TaxID=3110540 RepID=UPI00237A99AC|nr:PQQ-binding-like beta-propeller repeat protein [Paenibacillus humicola]